MTELTLKRVVMNVLMYLAVIIGMYFLYNPHNKHPDNNPHSDFSFIYAQF